jgi:hypothetical protein
MKAFIILAILFMGGCGIRVSAPPVQIPATPPAGLESSSLGDSLITLSYWGVWAAGLCLILSAPVFIFVNRKYGALLGVTAVAIAIASQLTSLLGNHLFWLSLVAGVISLAVGARYVWVKYGEDIDDALGIDIHDSGTDRTAISKADTVALGRYERAKDE